MAPYLTLYHGTTAQRYESIQREGMRISSPLADTFSLPVIFGCMRAEREKGDAIILEVRVRSDEFKDMPGGFAARATGQGQGRCFETTRPLSADRLKLIDKIPNHICPRFSRTTHLRQMYSARLRRLSLAHLITSV